MPISLFNPNLNNNVTSFAKEGLYAKLNIFHYEIPSTHQNASNNGFGSCRMTANWRPLFVSTGNFAGDTPGTVTVEEVYVRIASSAANLEDDGTHWEWTFTVPSLFQFSLPTVSMSGETISGRNVATKELLLKGTSQGSHSLAGPDVFQQASFVAPTQNQELTVDVNSSVNDEFDIVDSFMEVSFVNGVPVPTGFVASHVAGNIFTTDPTSNVEDVGFRKIHYKFGLKHNKWTQMEIANGGVDASQMVVSWTRNFDREIAPPAELSGLNGGASFPSNNDELVKPFNTLVDENGDDTGVPSQALNVNTNEYHPFRISPSFAKIPGGLQIGGNGGLFSRVDLEFKRLVNGNEFQFDAIHGRDQLSFVNEKITIFNENTPSQVNHVEIVGDQVFRSFLHERYFNALHFHHYSGGNGEEFESGENLDFRCVCKVFDIIGNLIDEIEEDFSFSPFPSINVLPASGNKDANGFVQTQNNYFCGITNNKNVVIGQYFKPTINENDFTIQGKNNTFCNVTRIPLGSGDNDTTVETISLNEGEISNLTTTPQIIKFYKELGKPDEAFAGDNADYSVDVEYTAASTRVTVKSTSADKIIKFSPNNQKIFCDFPVQSIGGVNQTISDVFQENGKLNFTLDNSNGSFVNTTYTGGKPNAQTSAQWGRFEFNITVDETVINSVGQGGSQSTGGNDENSTTQIQGDTYEIDYIPFLNESLYISQIDLKCDYIWFQNNLLSPIISSLAIENDLSQRGITLLNSIDNTFNNTGTLWDDADLIHDTSVSPNSFFSLLSQQEKDSGLYNGAVMNSNPSSNMSDYTPPAIELSAATSDGEWGLSGNKIILNYNSDTSTTDSNLPSNSECYFCYIIKFDYKDEDDNDRSVQFLYNTPTNNDVFQNDNEVNVANNTPDRKDLRELRNEFSNNSSTRFKIVDINYQGLPHGMDATKNVSHDIFLYLEERIDTCLSPVIDKYITSLGSNPQSPDGFDISAIDSKYTFSPSSITFGDNSTWAIKAINQRQRQNLADEISNYNISTTALSASSSEVADAPQIATFEVTFQLDDTSAKAPFAQSEKITRVKEEVRHTGFSAVTTGQPQPIEIFLPTVVTDTDFSTDEQTINRVIDLDVAGFRIDHDVHYNPKVFFMTKTNFGGSVDYETSEGSAVVNQNPTGGGISYLSELLPPLDMGTANEHILFTNPRGEVNAEDIDLSFQKPTVEIPFNYKADEFMHSNLKGKSNLINNKYFTISRENMKIERFLVQNGKQYIPTNESDLSGVIYDDKIHNINNQPINGASISNFTIEDEFTNAAHVGGDILQADSDATVVPDDGVNPDDFKIGEQWSYRYKITSRFIYSPGDEKDNNGNSVEIQTGGDVQQFDFSPEFLPLIFEKVDLGTFYVDRYSQELKWTYTNSNNIILMHGRDASMSFELFYKIVDDEQYYSRPELDRVKNNNKLKFPTQADAVDDSIFEGDGGAIEKWVNFDSVSLKLNETPEVGDESIYFHIVKYDRIPYNHKVQIAVLLKMSDENLDDDIDFQRFSQRLASVALGDENTSDETQALEATDDLETSILLSDEDKLPFDDNLGIRKSLDYVLNNLDLVPISVTRRKASVRGSGKPYSSST